MISSVYPCQNHFLKSYSSALWITEHFEKADLYCKSKSVSYNFVFQVNRLAAGKAKVQLLHSCFTEFYLISHKQVTLNLYYPRNINNEVGDLL